MTDYRIPDLALLMKVMTNQRPVFRSRDCVLTNNKPLFSDSPAGALAWVRGGGGRGPGDQGQDDAGQGHQVGETDQSEASIMVT